MFDRINVTPGPAYPQDIHHHHAPTMESIRLAEESLTRVRDSLVERIQVPPNRFNLMGEILLLHDPVSFGDYTLMFVFNLNGRDFRVERRIAAVVIDRLRGAEYPVYKDLHDMFYDVIREALTDCIFRHLTPNIKIGGSCGDTI